MTKETQYMTKETYTDTLQGNTVQCQRVLIGFCPV
jgi:hypothetical protein